MIEVREASPGEAQSWLDGWSERLQAWYGNCSGETQWVSQKVERRLTRWHEAPSRHLFTMEARHLRRGFLTSPMWVPVRPHTKLCR